MLKKPNSKGFTLIEVLIAVIILAMGLLGFAALQAVSLRNSQSTYYRSLATHFAYDMADRIRANTGAANQYLSAFMTPSAANPQGDCTSVAGCSPANMAENDLAEWNQSLSALPMADGSITVATGIYSITINWDDNRDGARDANDPNFTMSFGL